MRVPARLVPLTAVTAVSTLLTGCFSATGSDEGSASGEGKRIRVAHMQPPRSGLSPLSDDAFKLSRWSTAETLVKLNAEGDAQPALATKWERSGKTWTFTIRDGVTFHDGTELTAEAVVNSLTVAATASPKPRILDGVELTAKADGDKVTVTTAAEDPLVPQRLSSPQLSILAAKAYKGKTVDPVGAGTGPFELTKVNGTSSAALDRYDDYWGGKAKAPGIDVKFVPDGTARAAALRSGEADIVEAVPVSQAAVLDQDLITEVPMPRTNTLYLNTEKGVFKDASLRAAAREAVDAKSIVEGVYEGRADVAEGLLGPALPWAAELRSTVKHTKAGRPSGQTITIGTFTDRAELPEVAATLQQQLQKAGFKVELDVREYANIESDALAGEFDAFILSRATVLDSGDPAAYLYSDFASDGSFNLSQLADNTVDAALRKAADTAAGDARRKAVIDAEAAVLATDAAVPMLHERVIQGDAAGVVDAAHDPRERELVTVDTYVK
ncbi:ABC transporter substrate-binding protein [Streptomyces ipomoeae]|uniref:ABC transporter, substrate-binding protein, family 5 n=2 Tax=Streptomyces ipomoeae TaxID=103232 RepID=L1L156_9ACTN|nr:ABC transporter substrate-binding protein [Streptomyces ipomoeae]EKX66642.1 ABC transporter, substrate-binding protein, family 5 [Streptomyces ipomoeae 91-03]MDX2696976.1 ABC transporter substrate-binding protein [Streptomyces ipomoeae]MDX2825567.1 ABC transporter substrate-binding protein [Streptomyces ipomoeae]MDX2843865.1 ABC transporter substrate-binding protein [Streptomyces ipomoeae]MDX2878184.1 ABC transporter substrate-binding protein [Streptomyces ipomoeae]